MAVDPLNSRRLFCEVTCFRDLVILLTDSKYHRDRRRVSYPATSCDANIQEEEKERRNQGEWQRHDYPGHLDTDIGSSCRCWITSCRRGGLTNNCMIQSACTTQFSALLPFSLPILSLSTVYLSQLFAQAFATDSNASLATHVST